MSGYTKVPNDILETLIDLPLSGSRFRVIAFLLRETCGYHRNSWDVDYKQLAEKLHIDRDHISRTLTELEQMRVITVERGKRHEAISVMLTNPDGWSDRPFPR